MIPPDPLPRLPDPSLPNEESLYAQSDLHQVCGPRINPQAKEWYSHRQSLIEETSPVKSCAHPLLQAWLGDILSFDPRSQITQKPLREWPMTAIAPRVGVSGSRAAFPLQPMTYMIEYGELHRNPLSVPLEIKQLVPDYMPEGSRPILVFFGKREIVDGLWALTDFWEKEWLNQFDAIVAPDFSAFSDDPKPQSLIGERMQQIFAEEGSRAGQNIIPNIAWVNEESFARQVELWSSQYPKINTIHLGAHATNVDKTTWAWCNIFAFEKYLKDLPHIRWLISGMTQGWQIRELNRIFPNKNYSLVAPLHTYLRSTSGTADKDLQAKQFRQFIAKYQDFRSERLVADQHIRPDAWIKRVPIKS
jgi:hypothetical protein